MFSKNSQLQHLRNEPQLRFPGYDSKYVYTDIGQSTKQIFSGRTPNRLDSTLWGIDIPWITSGDIHKKYISNGDLFLNKEAFDNLSLHLIPKNSVLIGTAGQGKTRCTVGTNTRELCTNDAMLSMIPNDDVYYLYLLFLLEGKYQHLRLLTPQETKTRLSTNNLKSFKISLPELNEQTKTANFVYSVEKKIMLLKEKLENLKLFNKGLIDNLITKNISSSYLFGNLGYTVNGLTGKTKEDFGSGDLFVNYLNVFENRFIDIKKCEKVYISPDENQNGIKYGDIVFTTSSETPNEVGMSSVFMNQDDSKIYLNSFCFIFRLHSFNDIDPCFAGYYFRSLAFRSKMYKLAQGISRYNLSKGNLLKEQIEIPCIEKQIELSKIFISNDRKEKLVEEKLRTLKQFNIAHPTKLQYNMAIFTKEVKT